jgi:hypothetical protein
MLGNWPNVCDSSVTGEPYSNPALPRGCTRGMTSVTKKFYS